MKNLFITLFLLIFCTPSWSETLTIDNLVERNKLYYKKFTNVPFNGEVSGIENGNIKNGRKNGEWLYYYPNGQLINKEIYKDGKLDGLREKYYENGQFKMKGNLKFGWQDGLWEYFNEDGSLLRTETLKEGKKIETYP